MVFVIVILVVVVFVFLAHQKGANSFPDPNGMSDDWLERRVRFERERAMRYYSTISARRTDAEQQEQKRRDEYAKQMDAVLAERRNAIRDVHNAIRQSLIEDWKKKRKEFYLSKGISSEDAELLTVYSLYKSEHSKEERDLFIKQKQDNLKEKGVGEQKALEMAFMDWFKNGQMMEKELQRKGLFEFVDAAD